MARHKILVVDDDKEFAEEFAEMLDCFGCDVTIAESLLVAHQALSKGHFRFVVVDLNLRHESGLSLVHEWNEAAGIRFVLLSGRRLTNVEVASFAGLPPPLLVKPASGSAILKALGITD